MKALALFAVSVVLVAPPARAQDSSNPNAEAPIINPGQPENLSPAAQHEEAEMRARIQMARKDYAEAAKSYERLLKSDPKDAALLNQLGIAYQELGDFGQAERAYKRAIHADKNYASAMNNLGSLEYSQEHYKRAIKYYRKAVLIPDGARAVIYGNLGYAYFSNLQYAPALEAFGKALAIDPDVFGHKSGVGATVQQRSSQDPGRLYFLVAKSYAKTGDAEHAAHFLKEARDDGYRDFTAAKTDPDFARVIRDKRVQEVFDIQPVFSSDEKKL
ncbi:MAG TPA: tetratricopeptide repeat protein [Candidatus Aquilonibacter sp.]|nr:tetratricopeptide repeat protein [Candidatus Aquilonibacter sp.]